MEAVATRAAAVNLEWMQANDLEAFPPLRTCGGTEMKRVVVEHVLFCLVGDPERVTSKATCSRYSALHSSSIHRVAWAAGLDASQPKVVLAFVLTGGPGPNGLRGERAPALSSEPCRNVR